MKPVVVVVVVVVGVTKGTKTYCTVRLEIAMYLIDVK